ncbi:hypothetical protein D9M72_589060 [compost metagenome]
MKAEPVLREPGYHGCPEQPCRQVRLDMENLPSAGEPVQQGGHDKPGDTLATKASTDKQIADVELGAGQVSVAIHGHETGQFAVDPDQKRPGRGFVPIVRQGPEREKTGFAEFQR